MSPSVSENRQVGEAMPEVGPQQIAERVDRHGRGRLIGTGGGASREVDADFDEDPT